MKKLMMTVLLGTTVTMQAEEVTAEVTDTLKSVELQDVEVVATRASKKTPIAFTNMDKEQLKAVNHGQDIPYLLSLTPSVTMTSDAGNGIGYTTLRVRGTDPSRINITANGIPMNDAESAQLYWVNMGDFASSVQSMQIQRGVGTSTNGAGAFGATLNMQTENIGQEPYIGLDLSGGSYYSHKETLRFGTGLIKNHWGLQGRLSNIGSKGYLDRASTKLNSYLLQAGWFGDNTVVKFITWNGEEQTYHAWNYTSKYEQALYGRTYNSCGVMGFDEDGNPTGYYDNQTDNYHQQNYQLILNQRLSRPLSLNVALHYTRGDGYYEQYKLNRKLSKYGLIEYYGYEDPGTRGNLIEQKKMANDFYGVVASVVYNDRKGLEAAFGGGWNKYDGDHYGKVVGVPNFEYYRNNAKKTDFNIYAKVNYEFARGLSAFVDLQYRNIGYKMQDPTDEYGYNLDGKYIIDDKFNFFNPKFGLNYDITRNHKIYASFSIAHKEPTRNDYEDNIGTKLKAEQLNDLEVGYKFQSEHFSAGANIYWMSYKDQFVLTGELNDIGEAIATNVGKSYRLGVELEAAWMPLDWFRWDVNATLSRNRAKDWTVKDDDLDVVNLGDTPLSFSPDLIFNNILTFNYQGFKASVQSQYISDQYLTNTGFKEMECKDSWSESANTTYETLLLKAHFNTNVDLSYTFSLKQWGLKEVTAGVTLYNIFSAKYDNNGWAAPQFVKDGKGGVKAVNNWGLRDQDAAGFAPSAPFNMMAHLSINF
ncbi:MAG: TonB-dependent receptor [Prevotella sp.]|nr:TonB-dependent receptor [Prevotella sp.]